MGMERVIYISGPRTTARWSSGVRSRGGDRAMSFTTSVSPRFTANSRFDRQPKVSESLGIEPLGMAYHAFGTVWGVPVVVAARRTR